MRGKYKNATTRLIAQLHPLYFNFVFINFKVKYSIFMKIICHRIPVQILLFLTRVAYPSRIKVAPFSSLFDEAKNR